MSLSSGMGEDSSAGKKIKCIKDVLLQKKTQSKVSDAYWRDVGRFIIGNDFSFLCNACEAFLEKHKDLFNKGAAAKRQK